MAEMNFAIPNPFAQTALLHNEEESLLHFCAHRIRVVGSGNLLSQLYDLDSQTSQVLKPIIMASSTEDEPDTLTNFKSQRVMLRISTAVIDEVFTITRMLIFAKKLWSEYPR